MTSRLTLYNGALRHLKERRLETVSDDVTARHELDNAYDGSLAYCFEAGLWPAIKRTVELAPDPGLDPAFGYANAFSKPSDYVRLIGIADNGFMRPQLNDYQDEPIAGTGAWHANVSLLYVSYVSNGANWGASMALWPESFARAVEFDLAVRVAQPIASLGGADLDTLKKDAARALAKARSLAAMNEPAKWLPEGRLLRSRRGTFWNSGQRREN